MTTSAWRYSHFILAVSSFLLLTLASVSGIVLAFEPVVQQTKGISAPGRDTVTLAHTLPLLREKYKDIQQLKLDENECPIIRYSGEDGKDREAYINPVTGATMGPTQKKAPLFRWMTTLHRSLFLHETGRGIVGVVSFFLVLIAISGIGLVAKRQNGLRRFFARVEKSSFAQYYHTVFGRLSLVFILAIAVSGSYLSASRFLIHPKKVSARVDEDKIKEEPELPASQFAIFRKTKLADIETVAFPFSDFPEDYYKLKLKDRELCVNQLTGDVLAQSVYPNSYTLAAFSLRWHTGRTHPVWAVVLAITAGYILFFIYSGLAISWKRLGGRSGNRYSADESKFVILVGSENGSTMRFAHGIYRVLADAGHKVYIATLNKYAVYNQAEHLLVLTSTYGLGNAPDNAGSFLPLLSETPQAQDVFYSVVGFGSHDYPDFCRFGYEVDNQLAEQPWAKPLMEIHTVADQSIQDLETWFTEWAQLAGVPGLQLPATWRQKPSGLTDMTVVQKTLTTEDDGAFMISLEPAGKASFTSGDLLAIYPADDYRERLYSIGRIGGVAQLSVRRHKQGLGSGYLYGLRAGQVVQARIVQSAHFHFPETATRVVMICNGTGIAPFLGMADQNIAKLPCVLYCGFRDAASFAPFTAALDGYLDEDKLRHVHVAFSREGDKQYVTALVKRDAALILETLADDGVIMLCGSLTMQRDITDWLHHALAGSEKDLSYYQSRGRVLMDCY